MKILAGLISLAAAAGFCVGVANDIYVLRMATKPLPVLIMAIWVLIGAKHSYGRWVGAGLVACLAGDVLLELSDETFLAGVGAFLVGHVLYTVAYVGRSKAWRLWILPPFLLWGFAVVWGLRPGLEAQKMLIPVAIYSAAIMVMLWRAAACWEKGGASRVTWLAFGGALLFAVSDTFIAVTRFGEPFTGYRYAIILLYWIGQAAITASALTND